MLILWKCLLLVLVGVQNNVEMSLKNASPTLVPNDEVIWDIFYHGDLKGKSYFKMILHKATKNNFQFRTIISHLRTLELDVCKKGGNDMLRHPIIRRVSCGCYENAFLTIVHWIRTQTCDMQSFFTNNWQFFYKWF